ncbi:MAG: FecR family protein [Bacteroidota bacterium]
MSIPPSDRFVTADQLLLDERFMAWAGGADDSSCAHWVEKLRLSASEQEDEILEALLIYRAICRVEVPVSGATEQLDRLMERMERSAKKDLKPFTSLAKRIWVPMLVTVMIAGVFGVVSYFGKSQLHNTISGDGKLSELSDGTKVSLRGSSTISYPDGFEKKTIREVWVKGEAQFEVAHKKDDQPFIVHTGLFDIEVTGTRFIVNNQEKLASVLLQEGSVNLIFPNGEIARMNPGDYFSFEPPLGDASTGVAKLTPATLERHIVFDNTPFVQVAREIERRYEVQIKILDPALNDKLITGILPNNDLSALLNALASAMDCKITQESTLTYLISSL